MSNPEYEKIKSLAIKFTEAFEQEKTSYAVFNGALNLCITSIILQHPGKNLFEASEFLHQNNAAAMLHLAHEGWEYKEKPKKKRKLYSLLNKINQPKGD